MRAAAATLGPRLVLWPADALRRAARARPSLTPRGRRRIAIALLVGLALGSVYMLWLRDSSFVRVEKVSVTGLQGRNAASLRARLEYAARRMTTLHVSQVALVRSLGRNAGVKSLRVDTEFPHTMRIAVVQELPVAVLVLGADRAPVSAGGVLLPAMPATGVPAIDVGALPSHWRLGRGRAMRLVACAGAAPVDLLPRVDRIREIPAEGLVAYLRDGPRIIFGSAAMLRAKWSAAAAVLADPSSRGASYVDVHAPDRPVAGGVPLAFAPQDQVSLPGGVQGSVGTTGAGAATGTTPGATATAPKRTSTAPVGTAGGTSSAAPSATGTAGSGAAVGATRGSAGGTAASPAGGGTGATGHP